MPDTMRIEIRLFAIFREQIGRGGLSLELPIGATVADAARTLEAQYPGLKLAEGMAALNQAFVPSLTRLSAGDELAFLPPVSGGGDTEQSFGLTSDPLDPGKWIMWTTQPKNGAVITFLGTSRSPDKNREVRFLEYEAYASMAGEVMGQIIREMRDHWPLGRIALWHRVGQVVPAEVSILIVVASAHRGTAFEACRYAIDRAKAILPIWKKEVLANGDYWVEGYAEQAYRP